MEGILLLTAVIRHAQICYCISMVWTLNTPSSIMPHGVLSFVRLKSTTVSQGVGRACVISDIATMWHTDAAGGTLCVLPALPCSTS